MPKQRLIIIKFTEPTRENLEFMENMNMTYKEMIDSFECITTKSYISQLMKRYGIHHKTTYERIIDELQNRPQLLKCKTSELSIYFGCSRKLIQRAKEEMNDKNNN